MDTLHPFLFMGCWNNVGEARDAVISAVVKDPIPRLVLGGDNIYPEKKDGVKKYDPSILVSSAEKLSSKIVHVTFGNHNEDFYDIEKKLWGFSDDYYTVGYTDATIVIIDTNTVTDDARLSTMLAWLSATVNELRTANTPYYIVQHEPYVSLKKAKIQSLTNGYKLLDALIDYPPIAILCADTHNYQTGNIVYHGVSIPQIIVGTGGASYDTIDGELRDLTVGDILYTPTDYQKGYGYLRVHALGSYEFVLVRPWAGGRRRKTRRARRQSRRRRTYRKSRGRPL